MDVGHIVILMQENRSFDHYFGTLAGVRGYADPHPAPTPDGLPIWRQRGAAGRVGSPFRFDVRNTNFPVMKSLPHDFQTGREAWNGGHFDRWLDAKGPLTMGYLQREDLPYHTALADAFTLCDAYFCSLFGPTCPNRLFMMTGGNDPTGKGGGPVIECDNITQVPNGTRIYGAQWRTYPEQLQDAGIRWQTYRQGTDPYSDDDSDGGMNPLLAFRQFIDARPGSALHERGVRPRRLEELKADVIKGELAQVSWIFPPRIFCEHPKWPPAFGVEYIGRVMDALTSNPEVWSKTVFLLMYDENDGFFDHVPPPTPPLTRDRGISTAPVELERHPATGQPYGLGCRVPLIAISPWSRGGFVCSQVFDHTSIIRFIEARFGVTCENITPWRRTVAGDLTSVFDFSSPDASTPQRMGIDAQRGLPSQRDFDRFRKEYISKPKPIAPDTPAPVAIEGGTRRARPLPYRFTVEEAFADGAMTLTIRNTGPVGVALAIYDRLNPATPPRHYTVGAGREVSDTWHNPGGCDLTVLGPNGFVRTYKNAPASALSISVTENPGASLELLLRNSSREARVVSLVDAHAGATEDLHVAPNSTSIQIRKLADHHWYDLRIVARGLERHLAGCVETERPLLSCPSLSARKDRMESA